MRDRSYRPMGLGLHMGPHIYELVSPASGQPERQQTNSDAEKRGQINKCRVPAAAQAKAEAAILN
jgi:hypothetical protein